MGFISTLPIPAFIIGIVVLELGAFAWYMMSVRRGREEGVSIKVEKATFIAALIIGLLGIFALTLLPLFIT
jgi:uncharacterized membrane protein